MHIPDSMLQGAICPVTAVVSSFGIATAAYAARRTQTPPARFAGVTSLIFAGQMMNFPIMEGTSGHLLGGVLAASLLGTPLGVLSMALVVVIQSLLFSDGGITVLGANLFNMALVGAGVGGLLRAALAAGWRSPAGVLLATAVAAWASIVLASLAVSVELAMAGQIAFSRVVAAMVGKHALIGLGEAAITAAVCAWLGAAATVTSPRGKAIVPFATAAVIALALSPFACGCPDGLEWVAEKYVFLHEAAPAFVSPLPGYAVPRIGHAWLSTGLAGLLGVMVVFASAWALLRLMTRAATRQSAGAGAVSGV